jgi:hypothetical protein
MKRMLFGLILAAAGVLSIPAAAGAVEYETYVACSQSFSAVPATDCQLGDTPGAFFEADEETEYDVCVEFPSGQYLCALEQEAEAEVLYVNEITSGTAGHHYVDWWVGETLVGEWGFRLNAPLPPPPPPAPAPPPPAPPAIVPPVATPQISAACVKAKSKVRKLRKQLLNAATPKAKAKIRPRLRLARAAAKRLC